MFASNTKLLNPYDVIFVFIYDLTEPRNDILIGTYGPKFANKIFSLKIPNGISHIIPDFIFLNFPCLTVDLLKNYFLPLIDIVRHLS